MPHSTTSTTHSSLSDRDIMSIDTPTSEPHSRKRKASNAPGSRELTTTTIRNPAWTYLHLELIFSHPSTPIPQTIDAITARTHLSSALQQFLGLHGTAIPIDILKVEGRTVWIRVPREDGNAVVAAVGGWVGGNLQDEGEQLGWRVRKWGKWLPGLVGGDGRELFDE